MDFELASLELINFEVQKALILSEHESFDSFKSLDPTNMPAELQVEPQN